MRLLDLFCGAGGAAVGYHRAGFEVVGVDHKPQKHYPFPFILADALEYLREHGREYDAIHASPPCQAYSIMRNLPWLRDKEYPRRIAPTRAVLEEIGKPWVIENVMGAKLSAGWLCGTMFGLPFFRHRFFEAGGWFWLQLGHVSHSGVIQPGRNLGNRGHALTVKHSLSRWQGNGAQKSGVGIGHAAGWRLAAEAMTIDWMTRDELSQAIPPAYTEWIGKQLMRHLQGGRESGRRPADCGGDSRRVGPVL